MSKYVIDSSTLTAIGDAVRGKDGSTDPILVSEIASRITDIPAGSGGYDIPDDAFVFVGDTSMGDGAKYLFAHNAWNWFIENYGDRITTSNLGNSEKLFYCSDELEEIPFIIKGISGQTNDMFVNCTALKSIAGFEACSFTSIMDKMFYMCNNLRYLPTFDSTCYWRQLNLNSNSAKELFSYCYSLRSIPEETLKNFHNNATSSSGHLYRMFRYCYSLDEIRGLRIRHPERLTASITSNLFTDTFLNCMRVKDIIFDTDNGTPYVLTNVKNQNINLYTVGYYQSVAAYKNNILNYNSGITADKEVTDAATYEALKNDPDWFTGLLEYSRYNHDSAVNTINSLPDVATAGGTNTVYFIGSMGASTDGGAINTLTDAEVAVAAAKGWTIAWT